MHIYAPYRWPKERIPSALRDQHRSIASDLLELRLVRRDTEQVFPFDSDFTKVGSVERPSISEASPTPAE